MTRKGPWKCNHFTRFDHLLYRLREGPDESHDRSTGLAARGIRDELRTILQSRLDPHAVTHAAFAS